MLFILIFLYLCSNISELFLTIQKKMHAHINYTLLIFWILFICLLIREQNADIYIENLQFVKYLQKIQILDYLFYRVEYMVRGFHIVVHSLFRSNILVCLAISRREFLLQKKKTIISWVCWLLSGPCLMPIC